MADPTSSNSARDLIVIAVVVAGAIFGAQWWQKHHGSSPEQNHGVRPPAAVSNFLRELQGADMKAALNPFAAVESAPQRSVQKGSSAAPGPTRARDKLSSSDRDQLDQLIDQVAK